MSLALTEGSSIDDDALPSDGFRRDSRELGIDAEMEAVLVFELLAWSCFILESIRDLGELCFAVVSSDLEEADAAARLSTEDVIVVTERSPPDDDTSPLLCIQTHTQEVTVTLLCTAGT